MVMSSQTDEALMKYLDGVELTEAEIHQGLRQGTGSYNCAGTLRLCLQNKGVQLLAVLWITYQHQVKCRRFKVYCRWRYC